MLYISDAIVQSLLDQKTAVAQVRAALLSHADHCTGLSEPRSMLLHAPGINTFFHVKGASLLDKDVAGFRLGGFPPRGSGSGGMHLQLLTNLHTAVAFALVDEQSLFRIRVGAILAVTIEAFRSPNATTLALIGAGNLARSAVLAIQASTPFQRIQVTDIFPEQRERFYSKMKDQCAAELVIAETPAQACCGADVILTLTDANEAIVKAEWCRPGNLLVSAGGGVECEESAIVGADKIFIDDWEQCTQLGDLAPLHRQGKIQQTQITGTIGDVIAGRSAGRTTAEERIVAIPQGLTVLDIALGNYIYEQAKTRGLGMVLESE